MGRARTPRKLEAVRRNLGDRLGAGRPERPLSSYQCTCGAGHIDAQHKFRCPIGNAKVRLAQRERQRAFAELNVHRDAPQVALRVPGEEDLPISSSRSL